MEWIRRLLLQHKAELLTNSLEVVMKRNSYCKINTELAVNPFKCCHFTVDVDNGKT